MLRPTQSTWQWDIVSDKIEISDECAEVIGVQAFSGGIASFLELVHPQDRDMVKGRMMTAIGSRSLYDAEYRVLTDDEKMRWILSFGATEYSGGAPARMYGIVRDVTESHDQQTRLRESEENFRGLVESSTLFTWQADAAGYGKELYEWLSDLSGVQIKTVEDVISIIHPDDLDELSADWNEAIASRTSFSSVARFKSKAGGFRHLAVRGVQVFSPDGTFRQWIGTFNDISERIAAQQEHQHSAALMTAVLSSFPSNIVVLNADGVVIATNQGWQQPSFGEMPSETPDRKMEVGADYLQLCLDGIVAPGVAPAELAAGMSSVLSGKAEKFIRDYWIRGQVFSRCIQLMVIPLRIPEGGAVVSHTDVTDRKHAEDAVRKNEAMLKLVTDTVPTAIAYLDRDCRFRFANSLCCAWFSKSENELIGRRIRDLVGDEIFERVKPEFEAALSGQQCRFERESFFVPDKYIQMTYTPEIDDAGNVVGFFLFILDVTESKLSEERVRKSEEQLRQAQKLESIGRLAGGIAHDFNNMLTAINGYSELAILKLEPDSPLRRHLEEIRRAGERSSQLTQQLLAFSRQQLIEITKVNVNKVVGDSLEMLRRLIGEDVEIAASLDPNVPPIEGDANQLTQILLNLVVNSRDAMPHGGKITISSGIDLLDESFTHRRPGSTAGEYVRLSVTDTGGGIDEETQKHIFEPFFTTKETGKGTGLGLSMVYGIVKQLNGYVWVNSTPNGGTTFDIYFPPSVASVDPSKFVISERDLPRGVETVLLVEDEDMVRDLSRRVLESCGYQVVEAANGMQALKIFDEAHESIDLLMTDVVMPGMGGDELALRLTEKQPGLRVLFTSGYFEDSISIRLDDTRGADLIRKPFTFTDLALKVREVLDR
jgi:PAS domain S-box-containing protein